MRKTDYLIIGAGIVGCSAAYLLTKDGKKVTIVDKSYPCNEASGVNAGGMELLQQPPKSLQCMYWQHNYGICSKMKMELIVDIIEQADFIVY